MTKRTDAALHLRDAAWRKLRSERSHEVTNFGPILMWRGKDLEMSLRTPFQRLPPVPEGIESFAAKSGKEFNLDYGLDIWDAKRKVLNIEWSDTGKVELISFRRGDWEARVLASG